MPTVHAVLNQAVTNEKLTKGKIYQNFRVTFFPSAKESLEKMCLLRLRRREKQVHSYEATRRKRAPRKLLKDAVLKKSVILTEAEGSVQC